MCGRWFILYLSNMATLTTPQQIDRFRAYVLMSALALEIKGLKRSGPSAYSIIKREFNLKGSREKVLTQLQQLART